MTKENRPNIQVLEHIDHPQFGPCSTFCDVKGIGMIIGEGEESFIVRPVRPGYVSVEAETEAAQAKARELMAAVAKRRLGQQ